MKKKIFSAALAAATTLSFIAPATFAAEGYRGGKSHGCQAYIHGTNAWTNCSPATKSGQVATKAWCTAQPTRLSRWSYVGKGANVTQIALVGCTVNVHSAQTIWQ